MKMENHDKHGFVDFDENRENRGFTTSKIGVWRKRQKRLFLTRNSKTRFSEFRCFYLKASHKVKPQENQNRRKCPPHQAFIRKAAQDIFTPRGSPGIAKNTIPHRNRRKYDFHQKHFSEKRFPNVSQETFSEIAGNAIPTLSRYTVS